MAITATQIESSNSLEQFRQQFNNLQSDVSGLETGTLSFSTITTTSQNTTTLNVREDGTIKFEGATDDGFETTLTVVDPTADRVVSLPNETGTVISTGTTTNTLITGQTTITSGAIASGTDELLISDASAGTFKRVTVDNLISSAGGLTALLADTSPQLGGNLDTNSQNILIDDAHFIGDENGNEQIIFQTTSSAVNQIDITNAATGSGPSIIATGDDTNIDLTINPKGSGTVNIDSNVEISDGLIELKTGTGSVAKIKFYCESGNAHAQTLQAAPHSAASSAVLVLPTASGTLLADDGSGNVTVSGNLTVNGTTTTVNSTTVTIDDPVFTLGGDSAPGSDDNKDRGIEFRYHDGSAARVGFFGFDDSAGAFTFLTAATNSSEVFSGTIGNVTAGIGTFASLDISGNVDVDGTLETDALSIASTTVTATATELNFVDGVTSAIQTQLDTKTTATAAADDATALSIALG